MRYVNHKLRGAGAQGGSIRANRLYGINGGGHDSDPCRAEWLENLVPDRAGTVTKRNGFTKKQSAKIDALAVYDAYLTRYIIYLSEGVLYSVEGERVLSHSLPFDTSGMRPVRMGSYQFFIGGGRLVIYYPFIDEILYFYDGGMGGDTYTAYIPTIYIANTPDGAGASYEGVNMLCDRVAETCQGDGSSKTFKTHLEIEGSVDIYQKNEAGEWKKCELESRDAYSVTFKTAPTESAVEGEDNVKIVYAYKVKQPLFKKLSGCESFCVFGVGGNRDRLFLSGNVAHPGCVFYSALDNPLYFCDLDYIKVGDSETDVCSLAYYGSHLAVITDDGIYTVTGGAGQSGAIKQDALFLTDSFIASPLPVANVPSHIFGGEPVYLTFDGVYAVGASGILDERCADLRSQRINDALKSEDLKNCTMTVWGDRLVISNASDRLYILDSRQYSAYEGQPYARRQYEGYVWTGINAKVMWTVDDTLCFSNENGVFAFDGGYCDELSEGELVPIDAYWQTPCLYTNDLSGTKLFNTLSILVGGSSNLTVSARFDNAPWIKIKDYDASMRVFGYGGFDYGFFTYRSYVHSFLQKIRLLHKKGMGITLKIQNDRKDEPMTLVRFAVDYFTT